MVYNLSTDNSLITQWVSELRNIAIHHDRMRFRKNMERIGEVIAYEISKHLEYTEVTVQTPLGESASMLLRQQPVLATILRAGIPLHQGLVNYFDQGDCAFVAAYRKHHRDGSFEIARQYLTCPPLQDRILIIADPMLATGASLALSLEGLLAYGIPSAIHIVTAIGCSIGIEYVLRKYPDAHIWAAAIDDEITAKGYIVPGLGDAGDLAYGEKEQN